MKAKLVCYSLKGLEDLSKVKLCRELYGYKTYSNHGKYKYEIKGLIHDIKIRKITDSVLLAGQKDSSKITGLLKRYGAKIHVFTVLLRGKL